VLQGQGKLGEAEPLYREALDGRRRTLGDSHPDTLTSVRSLAIFLEALMQLDEAEALYRELCKGYLRSLGASHPDVKASLDNLKRFLRAHGR
jgi:hypothetical protein